MIKGAIKTVTKDWKTMPPWRVWSINPSSNAVRATTSALEEILLKTRRKSILRQSTMKKITWSYIPMFSPPLSNRVRVRAWAV